MPKFGDSLYQQMTMTKKRAWLIIGFLITLTVLLSTVLPKLYFDYEFDNFFNPSEQTTVYFNEQRDTFGTDNDFALIGIESENTAFDSLFLAKIDALTKKIEEGILVSEVISPTNAFQLVKAPLTGIPIKKPLYNNGRIDSTRVSQDQSTIGQLYSTDNKSVSIIVLTDQQLSKKKCDDFSSFLHEAAAKFEFKEIHISGRAIGQSVYIDKIQKEFFLFIMISVAFVMVLLYVMFRNKLGVAIPLVIVFISVLWTMSVLYFLDTGIGLLMSMIPPVIFVVGISDAVHLYARFLEEQQLGESLEQSIKTMMGKTGLATFITSVTTSIGFGTLYFTGIPALQDFGIITGIGVIITFLVSILLLPAMLFLFPKGHSGVSQNKKWERKLERLYAYTIERKKLILSIGFAFTIMCALIGSQLKMNNFLLEDLKSGDKLKDDSDFFDKEFSGVRPFELGIKTDDSNGFISQEKLELLEPVHIYVRDQYGVNSLQSMVSVAYEINRMNHGGSPDYYNLPKTKKDWNTLLKDFRRLQKTGKLQALLNDEGNYSRFFGRVPDLGALTFKEKDKALKAFVNDASIDKKLDIQITGTGHLIDQTNQNLIYNLAKGLIMAFILISILMGFLFKSWRMVFIALVPNILPILTVAAAMALLGIDLKLTTGIIFTIAFGIAVDDTIHILSRYKLEMRGGATPQEALQTSIVHTGKALIITSLILFGGFLSLCFSSFQSTFYIGLLVTITLIFALIFDLTILPALLSQKKN